MFDAILTIIAIFAVIIFVAWMIGHKDNKDVPTNRIVPLRKQSIAKTEHRAAVLKHLLVLFGVDKISTFEILTNYQYVRFVGHNDATIFKEAAIEIVSLNNKYDIFGADRAFIDRFICKAATINVVSGNGNNSQMVTDNYTPDMNFHLDVVKFVSLCERHLKL